MDFAGGRVKTPDGQLVSWRVSPIRYCVQPGHTYLMQLTEYPGGSYYDIDKEWDVITRKVVADRPDAIARAEKGRSKLSGRSLPDVVLYLESIGEAKSPNRKRTEGHTGSQEMHCSIPLTEQNSAELIWRNRRKKPRPFVSHTSRNARNFCERGHATPRCPRNFREKTKKPELPAPASRFAR